MYAFITQLIYHPPPPPPPRRLACLVLRRSDIAHSTLRLSIYLGGKKFVDKCYTELPKLTNLNYLHFSPIPSVLNDPSRDREIFHGFKPIQLVGDQPAINEKRTSLFKKVRETLQWTKDYVLPTKGRLIRMGSWFSFGVIYTPDVLTLGQIAELEQRFGIEKSELDTINRNRSEVKQWLYHHHNLGDHYVHHARD